MENCTSYEAARRQCRFCWFDRKSCPGPALDAEECRYYYPKAYPSGKVIYNEKEYTNNTNRSGDWIETFTGKKMFPLDPRPEEVDIVDIAHHLSLICRYNGASKHLYTVGQHSLHCASVAGWYSPRMQLLCLLHDASEAYISDVSKPVKPYLAGYKDIERKLMDVIWYALGINPPSYPESLEIKLVDKAVMVAEAKKLMHFDGWGEWVRDAVEVEIQIKPETPERVEQEFLARFGMLVGWLK